MAAWSSIVAALVGGFLAVGGTVLLSVYQHKNERDTRLQQQSRDDRFRLHEQRLVAYSDFYTALGDVRRSLWRRGRAPHDPDALASAKDARDQLWQAYTRVALIGDRAVFDSASSLLNFADVTQAASDVLDDDRWRELVVRFVRTARSDLLPPELDGRPSDGTEPRIPPTSETVDKA